MEKTKRNKIIVIAIVLIAIVVMVGLYLGLPMQKQYNNLVMGGITLQTFIKANIINQGSIGDDILAEITKVDTRTDPKNEKSDVYRINHSSVGEVVRISPLTIKLLEVSKDMFDKTGGLFNPAVYTLVDMWGLSAEKFTQSDKHIPPTEEQIALGVKLADKFSNIEFINEGQTATEDATFIVNKQNNTLIRTEKCFVDNVGAKIDLGGIAKGYATELAYNVFSKSSAENGLVNLGGNVYTYGKDWKVGIENPFKKGLFSDEDSSLIFGVSDVKNLSVSCSGVYLRNYKHEGKLYHHIINPLTGYPTDTTSNDSLVMAAVFGKDGAVVDALATTLILKNSISSAEDFVKNNYTEQVSAVILINRNKQYKVIGDIPFTFNEKEMVGFTKI